MFGLFSKKNETTKTLQATDPQAENIPIHTMARDMASLDQPGKEEGGHFLGNILKPEPEAKSKGLSELQKNSPFLNRQSVSNLPPPPVPKPKIESFAKPVSVSSPSLPPLPVPKPKRQGFTKPVSDFLFKDTFASDPKTRASIGTDRDAPNKDERGKLIAILIIILLITATALGGYYFWSTRKSTPPENAAVQEIVNDPIPEAAPDPEETIPEEQPAPAFSSTEKNYFMIELGNNSLISFKGMLTSYYEKIVASKISYPVEFTVINAENSPIDFRTFAQALNIKFSPEMMSAIDDSFNLFVYDDHGSPGVGLSIKVKGEMNPEDILLKEEVSLPGELESIFPVSQFTIENGKAFTTSEYNSSHWGKIGIRFQNIISPQNLSVDYSFVNTGTDMLFIGTTRDTLRSIVDEAKPFIVVP